MNGSSARTGIASLISSAANLFAGTSLLTQYAGTDNLYDSIDSYNNAILDDQLLLLNSHLVRNLRNRGYLAEASARGLSISSAFPGVEAQNAELAEAMARNSLLIERQRALGRISSVTARSDSRAATTQSLVGVFGNVANIAGALNG